MPADIGKGLQPVVMRPACVTLVDTADYDLKTK